MIIKKKYYNKKGYLFKKETYDENKKIKRKILNKKILSDKKDIENNFYKVHEEYYFDSKLIMKAFINNIYLEIKYITDNYNITEYSKNSQLLCKKYSEKNNNFIKLKELNELSFIEEIEKSNYKNNLNELYLIMIYYEKEIIKKINFYDKENNLYKKYTFYNEYNIDWIISHINNNVYYCTDYLVKDNRLIRKIYNNIKYDNKTSIELYDANRNLRLRQILNDNKEVMIEENYDEESFLDYIEIYDYIMNMETGMIDKKVKERKDYCLGLEI
jgi:hypothetical protein